MTETSPLTDAQQKFSDTVANRHLGSEACALEQALGRTLHDDVCAPEDSPPYHRAIVEGFLVHTNETQAASEDNPVHFSIVGQVNPGDEACPTFGPGEAIEVATGSILPDGKVSIVRMWEAKRNGNSFTTARPFPPRFFIEEQGYDIKQGRTILEAGTVLEPSHLGTLASLGITEVQVSRAPIVAIFASGDEVIPYTAPLRPGAIRDCNSVQLAAAVKQAGGQAQLKGIMGDDFDTFVTALRDALKEADMVIISGGTAVGGRDFVSDLISEVGELIIDGVPMRSGRPLIMGRSNNKPIIGVAGHPPEALRGFNLFGASAMANLLGREEKERQG